MKHAIRGLSAPFEVVFVVGIAFGAFIAASLATVIAGTAGSIEALTFDEKEAAFLVRYELFAAALLFAFLHVRGWSLADIDLRPTWSGTGHGLLLVIASMALFYTIDMVQMLIVPQLQVVPPAQVTISAASIVLLSLVNGHFEEIFVAGYLITAIHRRASAETAIAVSVMVRVLYHLYQGAGAMLSHAALGWFFAWVYLRRRDLWPLIVAHVILDLWAIGGAALATAATGNGLGIR